MHAAASFLKQTRTFTLKWTLIKVFSDSRNRDTVAAHSLVYVYVICTVPMQPRSEALATLPSAQQSYTTLTLLWPPGILALPPYSSMGPPFTMPPTSSKVDLQDPILTKLMKACIILLINWTNGESLMWISMPTLKQHCCWAQHLLINSFVCSFILINFDGINIHLAPVSRVPQNVPLQL